MRNSVYLYGAQVATAIGGGLYWLLFAALLGPEPLGRAAYVVSLSAVAYAASQLGLNYVVMRVYAATGEPGYVYAAYLYNLAAASAASTATYLAASNVLGPAEAAAAAALTLLQTSTVLQAALVAAMRAHAVFVAVSLGLLTRFAVSLALLPMGWLAVALGYVSGFAVSLVVLGALALRYIRPSLRRLPLRDAVYGGVSAWAPQLAQSAVLGGTLAVYHVAGAGGAGVYYVSWAVASIVAGLSQSVARVALPYFAGGGQASPGTVLRLQLAMASPILAAALAAPRGILSLLGGAYEEGWALLSLLSAALYVATANMTLLNYMYAGARYARFLAYNMAAIVGIVGAVPAQAALGYHALGLGALLGNTAVLVVLIRELRLPLASLRPMLVALGMAPLALLHGPYWPLVAVGAAITALYRAIRLGSLTRDEAKSIARAALPRPLAELLAKAVDRLP